MKCILESLEQRTFFASVAFARLQRIDLQSIHDFINAVLAEVDAEAD